MSDLRPETESWQLAEERAEAGLSRVVPSVTTGPVDVDLLRGQRDLLLTLFTAFGPEPHLLDGLVNLLDDMLDVAEGFA